jgi:hypothetical protein
MAATWDWGPCGSVDASSATIAAVSFGWSNGVVTLIHPPDGNRFSVLSAFEGTATVNVSRRAVVSADTNST